jgi:hypothetical protein
MLETHVTSLDVTIQTYVHRRFVGSDRESAGGPALDTVQTPSCISLRGSQYTAHDMAARAAGTDCGDPWAPPESAGTTPAPNRRGRPSNMSTATGTRSLRRQIDCSSLQLEALPQSSTHALSDRDTLTPHLRAGAESRHEGKLTVSTFSGNPRVHDGKADTSRGFVRRTKCLSIPGGGPLVATCAI